MLRALLLCAVVRVACAQSFEVASIKLHPPPIQSVGVSTSGTRVSFAAMSLSNLVGYAYGLNPYQLGGVTGRMSSDRWDIEARAPGTEPPSREQMMAMMAALLTERFHLKFHRESKDMAVYVLLPGKVVKLKESTRADAEAGLMMSGSRPIVLEATKTTVDLLVRQLSGNIDRPVIDKTGLTGKYDFLLEWLPERMRNGTDDALAPSIFNALQEQLGLRLEATQVPLQVLVIDEVQKPSAN